MLDITNEIAVKARADKTVEAFREAGCEITHIQAETFAINLATLNETEYMQAIEAFVSTH
jgi:N-acetylglucosamine kinase-like BadF-type ATPase